jgi:hypothetical protein
MTRKAEHARAEALASASPAMVPADAREWLESNGFQVVIWNPHDPNGFVGLREHDAGNQRSKNLIVEGQRQVRQEGWMVEPKWLNLTFLFTLDGKFQDVEAKPSRLKLRD